MVTLKYLFRPDGMGIGFCIDVQAIRTYCFSLLDFVRALQGPPSSLSLHGAVHAQRVLMQLPSLGGSMDGRPRFA